VLIANAGKLTPEAQNSFLKILEEPPINVHFLLGANNQFELLETIRSRTVVWNLIAPTKQQIIKYFDQYPSSDVERTTMISGERVGLICSLLTKSNDHKLIKSIEYAKELLSAGHFKRMVLLNSYLKNNQSVLDLLDALGIIAVAAMEKAIDDKKSIKRWLDRVEAINLAKRQLSENLQVKLILSRLFLVL
jgi:DNA polymerase-3 subunit delta'